MIGTGKRRGFFFAPLILAGSFLFTSCGLSSLLVKNAAADIKKAVAGYFDEMQDGTFADNDYESDYASDVVFDGLTYADPDVQAIMNKSLEKIDVEIGDASGTVRSKEGTCDVTITYIDIEEILSNFEDEGEGFDADALMDAVKDRKAPTDEEDITLDLTYDTSAKSWQISDTSPLFDLLGKPYEAIAFGPDASDLTAPVDTFMAALAAGDNQAIDTVCTDYDSTDFFYDDEVMNQAKLTLYSNISYAYEKEPSVSGTEADVYVSVTMPDYTQINDNMNNDVDFSADLFTPYLLAEIEGTDIDTADEQVRQIFADEMSARMNASDAPRVTYDLVFTLTFDEETGSWLIENVPPEIYDYTFETDGSDELYAEASLKALENLYNAGAITEGEYNEYYIYLTEGDESSSDNSQVETCYASWYDIVSETSVDSYDAAVTKQLEYWMEFTTDMTGASFYYDWYNYDTSELLYSDSETLGSGDDNIRPALTYGDNELIPAGDYELIITLNGSLFADEVVTVG